MANAVSGQASWSSRVLVVERGFRPKCLPGGGGGEEQQQQREQTLAAGCGGRGQVGAKRGPTSSQRRCGARGVMEGRSHLRGKKCHTQPTCCKVGAPWVWKGVPDPGEGVSAHRALPGWEAEWAAGESEHRGLAWSPACCLPACLTPGGARGRCLPGCLASPHPLPNPSLAVPGLLPTSEGPAQNPDTAAPCGEAASGLSGALWAMSLFCLRSHQASEPLIVPSRQPPQPPAPQGPLSCVPGCAPPRPPKECLHTPAFVSSPPSDYLQLFCQDRPWFCWESPAKGGGGLRLSLPATLRLGRREGQAEPARGTWTSVWRGVPPPQARRPNCSQALGKGGALLATQPSAGRGSCPPSASPGGAQDFSTQPVRGDPLAPWQIGVCLALCVQRCSPEQLGGGGSLRTSLPLCACPVSRLPSRGGVHFLTGHGCSWVLREPPVPTPVELGQGPPGLLPDGCGGLRGSLLGGAALLTLA